MGSITFTWLLTFLSTLVILSQELLLFEALMGLKDGRFCFLMPFVDISWSILSETRFYLFLSFSEKQLELSMILSTENLFLGRRSLMILNYLFLGTWILSINLNDPRIELSSSSILLKWESFSNSSADGRSLGSTLRQLRIKLSSYEE